MVFDVHLLTTGSEGDIATNNDMAVYQRLHADPNIDYLTIHIWPKNWGWFRDTATVRSLPMVLGKVPKVEPLCDSVSSFTTAHREGVETLPQKQQWWTLCLRCLLLADFGLVQF